MAFAAHKHRLQRRKDPDACPYINHPIALAAVLADVGYVSDRVTLLGAILHDTVEDTETTFGEIEHAFGPEVRRVVEEVTDDKRLPKAERKQLQVEHAAHISDSAKLVKLADKICNVLDVAQSPPADWSVARRLEYLEWSERVVAGCRGVNEVLERHFDDVLSKGRAICTKPIATPPAC